MSFSKEDEKRLKRLGVSNLLDLALITPSSYEDRRLHPFVRLNELNAVSALIKSVSFSPKNMRLILYAENLKQTLTAVIFNPKNYHKKSFKEGERYFLIGRVENYYGHLQLLQPKILDSVGEITPKYKTPLRSKSVFELMKRYLSLKALLKEGLLEEEAKRILDLHFPKNFVPAIDKEMKLLKFVEIFNYMKKLSTKRVRQKASKTFQNPNPNPFINSLPFRLTNDQIKAIEDIKRDLESEYAAKRVVMGDVGCGKTMVMLASAFMVHPSKAVLMAPTTVLAEQIYNEAKKYLSFFDIKIALVTNKSKKEDLNEYDFIIGTHALLYRDLPKCDLVMVDEQHRFGTVQREMIKKLISKDNLSPHYIQFSATPIPRTLSLIESNLVDYSFIKELPFKKDITTKIVTKKDFRDLIAHIKSEADKSNQTIIVYPLVEESEAIDYLSIDEAKDYWLKHFEGVYVTHGKDRDKGDVLKEFREKGKILIATTLIEVGISLPKLTTIVIVAPERMGLATLHQLRGRVSRNGLKGYCFLFTKHPENERLKAFCETLDGFEIAKLDLKFRQSGDILKGEQQSGKSFRFFDPALDEEIAKEAKKRVESV
ncbi:MAG: ATP-dependent DNA helicase RecG, partial [Epsilonproteobacteria bacterium]|nr:ATP-dependent DNA helicase RecG [Campylobacterota bacterium]